MQQSRRKVLMSGLGLGATAAVLPSAWTKPIINSVVLPAHAQASVCPMITIGNVTFGPFSAQPTPGAPEVCALTFDVLSSDTTALTITNVTNSTLAEFNSVTYDGFGEATDTTGPRITWQGPASDAPFCSDLMPIDSVTFTVTATCEAADMGEFSQDFTIEQILTPA